MFLSSRKGITKNKANDLLCFDIPIVPGCRDCARCSSELSEILNGKNQNKDLISPLTSDLNNPSVESEI